MQSKFFVDVDVVAGEINGMLNIEPTPIIRLPKLIRDSFFNSFVEI